MKKNILWVKLKGDQDYIKKVKVRAAVKKPTGLSIRDFCQGIAMEQKKAVNEKMKERKKNCPALRWRLDIQGDDFVLLTKRDQEPQWTHEDLEDLGDIPSIKWDSGKRGRDSPGAGDHSGARQEGPPQPRPGLSPESAGQPSTEGAGDASVRGRVNSFTALINNQ